jgi:RNA polymerase sigma-70 factor (ECF subfamily)
MLGSVFDADDALQETLVRAWRGVDGLRRAGSARAWLYAIATNVCLTELERRQRRVLPRDLGPAAAEHTPPGEPVAESTWLEPYPDDVVGIPDGRAAPEAVYERRESLELAFIAATQHLVPNQRAVLLLREVLGFSAEESAGMLDTTVASVNSALQRARSTVGARMPAASQQANLQVIGDRALDDLVRRYISAWERNDVDAFTGLLTADASFAMPPLGTWYAPRETVATWARESSLSGAWRWKAVLTRANAQPALAFYAWDAEAATHLPFALNLLSLSGELVCDVTAFIVRSTEPSDATSFERFPERALDPRRSFGVFERFGLPGSVD